MIISLGRECPSVKMVWRRMGFGGSGSPGRGWTGSWGGSRLGLGLGFGFGILFLRSLMRVFWKSWWLQMSTWVGIGIIGLVVLLKVGSCKEAVSCCVLEEGRRKVLQVAIFRRWRVDKIILYDGWSCRILVWINEKRELGCLPTACIISPNHGSSTIKP